MSLWLLVNLRSFKMEHFLYKLGWILKQEAQGP